MRCNWNALVHGRKSVASAVVVFGRAFLCVVLLGVVSIGASNSTRAQDYPSRPITMVMGIAPGGIMDTAGRLYAQLVSQKFWDKTYLLKIGLVLPPRSRLLMFKTQLRMATPSSFWQGHSTPQCHSCKR